MARTIFVVTVLFALLGSGCSRAPERPADHKPAPRKPSLNVLLITIDTLRADYVACYGRKRVDTPNMDALAARGARMAQAIAQVPLTAPSHASILTGTYPQVHKIRDMGGFVLDKDVPTLATVLQGAGYDTAAFVGSAVLSHHYGVNRGFGTYVDSMKEDTRLQKLPGVVAEIRGEVVAGRALDWLKKHSVSGKNFFAWVHFYDPHFPYDPPEPFRSRYPKDPYGGEVAYADEQVGKLTSWLSEAGLADRTLVVLMSDHGESLGDHGEYTHGVFLYDSTVHVPLIIAGPGVPQGRVVAQQVRSIDVMPTVADFAGTAPGDKVQGVSLRDAVVEGKGTRSNYCYMETLYPRTHMGWSELRGMRTDELKLIVGPKPELYRFMDDREEARNLVDKLPADADRLQKKVWEVAGPPKSLGQLEPQLIDDERRRELDALGYVSSGRRSVRIDMSGPDPKDRVAVLGAIERASEAMNHDQWGTAAPALEKILPQDPSNPLLYKTLQLCYERMGRFDAMERVCLAAIKNGADGDETYAKLGEVQVRRGDLKTAVGHMEKAAQMNPANLQNMDNMATAYLQLGRLDDAQRALQAILLQDPQRATAHNVLGILEIQRGQTLQGREHLEKAIEADPELIEPYLNLGILAQKAGDSPAAIRYFRGFLKRARPEKYRDVIPKVKAALAELGAIS